MKSTLGFKTIHKELFEERKAMANMSQMEEKMPFSSPLSSSFPSQMPQGEKRSRRRRKKAKKAEDGSGGEGKKRRLTEAQVNFLETKFSEERKLESRRKEHLAAELGLEPKQVAVWFQNRRAWWKNKQLEDDYLKLKSHHHVALLEKCHLENEVLKLKKQVDEAEEEIKRLSGCTSGGGERGSLSSSTTITSSYYQPDLGEFGLERDDLIYENEYNYFSISYIMDWGYLL